MSKAINWPLQFRDAVMNESVTDVFAAVRLGRLYFDNQYWVAGETILIRVNHKAIRQAIIVGDLQCMPIQDLPDEVYQQLKSGLQSEPELAAFLSQTYEKPVNPETEVTVVIYRNLPIDPEILEVEDDPHM